jgi:hypothetical protein
VLRSIQFHMSMYLAAILGLCALTASSVTLGTQLQQLSQKTQPLVAVPPDSPQDATQNSTPANPPLAPPQAGEEPQSEPSAKPAQPGSSAKKPESPAKAPSKKRRRRKTSASNSTATPPKKVVRNGGAADPVVQLAPGMSAEQASSQRQNTTQLLAATDANLKEISSRPMNSSQQASVDQIRKYMEQAKTAEQAGDVERAHNLASKALLLSDDLAKQ